MTAPVAAPVATRHAYRDWLIARMRNDPRVICLDSDTGLFTGADFGTAADRYLDLGIAEQNLFGVAAGLAHDGWLPYVNTMAAFAASRAAEAVKIDIAYNRLPVRIAATHGGLAAGHLGPTHHALEDLAVMRAMPSMTVLVPGDAADAVALLDQAHDYDGPVYLRLGRKPTPDLPPAPPPRIGVPQVRRDGTEVCLLACGPLPTLRVLAAAEALAATEGVNARVVQVHTLKPLDDAAIAGVVRGCTAVVTVEEHWREGGLGSAVAELLASQPGPRLVRMGVGDMYVSAVGSQEELLDALGITAAGIARAARSALRPGLDSPLFATF
ncbi:transketolase C-terminal domain-containing protein [Plantactinospora mayteni]|uniref:Transketolase n=1 Tax=Plantactinospora mayteni TaxID=566021 RepID=A0ABQ4EH21_9ACTN|nr:transketolase C-terminal domain-containing protein [Plantactinospora mayteni]GIG94011.1 transketolase [Plantactinospora mayteni]